MSLAKRRAVVLCIVGGVILMAFAWGYFVPTGDVSTEREWLNLVMLAIMLLLTGLIVIVSRAFRSLFWSCSVGCASLIIAWFSFGLGHQAAGSTTYTSPQETSPVILLLWLSFFGLLMGVGVGGATYFLAAVRRTF